MLQPGTWLFAVSEVDQKISQILHLASEKIVPAEAATPLFFKRNVISLGKLLISKIVYSSHLF